MLNRLFPRRRPTLPAALAAEVLSMCRAQQVETLHLSRHLLKDIGADCGCDGAMPRR